MSSIFCIENFSNRISVLRKMSISVSFSNKPVLKKGEKVSLQCR